MAKKRSRPTAPEGMSFGRILFSGLGGFLFLLILVFLASVLFRAEKLPWESRFTVSAILIAVSSAVSGFFAARRNGRKLICSFLGGAVMVVLLLLSGTLLFGGGIEIKRLWITLGCTLAGTIGGGILAGAAEK